MQCFTSLCAHKILFISRWGKKNFPYEECATFKNKTVEVSKEFMKRASLYTQQGASKVKEYSKISYKWVSIPTCSIFLIKDMNGLHKFHHALISYLFRFPNV